MCNQDSLSCLPHPLLKMVSLPSTVGVSSCSSGTWWWPYPFQEAEDGGRIHASSHTPLTCCCPQELRRGQRWEWTNWEVGPEAVSVSLHWVLIFLSV